jgi:UDP-2,4-diacetamido-2,4,6-trideoxy-beta-L-altropyranose hydrolase
MRCLTLADALRAEGASCTFVARELPRQLADKMLGQGHGLIRLEEQTGDVADDAAQTVTAIAGEDCDWLIVDSYALDYRWEQRVRGHARAVLVMDDLADRRHDCDLLVDQNYYADAQSRYASLVPEGTRCLLGPGYALLRAQFAGALPRATQMADRLFVAMGGSDQFDICAQVIELLRRLGARAPGADIVAGTDTALFARLGRGAEGLENVRVHGFVDDIATLMARCNMAIGAGGSSTWERCALGLPALVIVTADNQRRMSQDLAHAGLIVLLGEAADVSVDSLGEAVARLRADAVLRSRLSDGGMRLVDGQGVRRVVQQMLGC